MSNVKISKWIHPKTGETRVYINGIGGYGTKVFVCEMSGYTDGTWEIRVSGNSGLSSDFIIDMAESELIERNGGERPTFEQIKKMG